MKNLLAALLWLPASLLAAGSGYPLDHAPIEPRDLVSLQSGARTFVNYCLNCHSAQYMRYNRLSDLGLTEPQIRDNLMFAADKVGETMKVAMTAKDGKAWFGVPPPDLSVIARSRGADWLYTYLRAFYRDDQTASGWNNAVFPNVAMPHALWKLQGERDYEVVAHTDKAGHVGIERNWKQLTPGTQGAIEYDRTVRDLVNFLVYVGEPAAQSRKAIGIVVLFVLGVLYVFAYAMKKAFWKDVR
ncbi:MAG: cytochrome c1 [Betaproteobacteria bacterium]|nr:cytochrome c1 [Betaproteobacteria bacterium]